MATNALPQSVSHILQERGRFWWADTPLPTSQFAPEMSAVGELTIDSDGHITLDLDGLISAPHTALSALLTPRDEPELQTRKIQGLLKNSNKHVLLLQLSRRGGRFSTSNVSTEGFQ